MQKTIFDKRYRRVIQQLTIARQKRGLTQQQLGTRIGWPRSTVSKVETLERKLDLLEAHVLANTLGLRLSDLEPLLLEGKLV